MAPSEGDEQQADETTDRLPSGTLVEDLGCPHCGKVCDVCMGYDEWCASLRAENERLCDLIGKLTDADPCQYDHNDLCQAHHLDRRPCPHELAKALLDPASSVRTTSQDVTGGGKDG